MVWGMAEGQGGARLQSRIELHVYFTEWGSKTGTPTFLCAGYTASCSDRWASWFVAGLLL